MFFQINVTPEAKKPERKIPENAEEQYTLILAPFQPQTRVKLDTTINNAVQCRLNIQNPSNKNLQVTVSRTPPEERSIALTALELLVEADSSADLGITWTPQECGSWRDILQLTDSRRIKYDVALITTALTGGKGGTKGRSRVLAPSNSNKTTAMKPRKISPPLRELKKSATTAVLGPSTVPNKRPRLNAQPENKENFKKPDWTHKTSNYKQTNPTPNPQGHDFSAIMNSTGFNLTPLKVMENHEIRITTVNPIKFSPQGSEILFPEITNPPVLRRGTYNAAEYCKLSTMHHEDVTHLHCDVRRFEENPEIRITKANPVKFSPQTPGILSPEITNPPVLRRETYNAAEYCKLPTMHQEEEKDHEKFADSLSPQPEKDPESAKQPNSNFEARSSDFSMLINDINFLTPEAPKILQAPTFSPIGCLAVNRTKPTTENLSPSASSLFFPGNDTFNVSGITNAANNSQANGTYELLVSPTRSTDSIKPTRLSKNFVIMSPVLPAGVSAPPSSTPLCFERLSMKCDYESRRPSVCHNTSRLSIYEDASVKDVLEADLWVKPDVQNSAFSVSSLKGRCSSLEEIPEEPRFHSMLNKTKTLPTTKEEKISKTRRIEISPPKKFSSCAKNGTIRRVSPTKGTKIRKEKSVLEPAASLRKKVQMNCSIKRGQVSIPGVRVANLSLAGLRKTGKEIKKTSVKSESKEVSVRLHDPNDFITRFCNPDPFGATMTQDPFLTSTLYYDEKWIYLQEMEFKKWLNALLTPPEHLNADVDTFRVDVGKVWQSCRSREDVALAETREAVSARYHTNTRLNTLRKAACAMFRREEVVAALSKATVCVERGTLMIRQDRDVHRDIGLQKEILELFLSYNPLWLRIGLETIYGETIPLHSNNDLVGLTKFLIARFFSDPFIVKTHSHSNTTSIKMPTFNLHMNKFVLKKFFLIVYFLDYAKRNKLIGHDPCLFHKKATHKESRAILLTFSRELLSGVGDVTKVLRSHGYVVSHKQTYLDEYDYAVKDISTDLRDGVRLCRVMELITGDRNLTCRCRVPAISRLQKVHNADVALTALLRCGYTLTGDIDAKSITDGHREKTLSLLWQIIYKYQAPRFDKAAKTVQKFWRAKLWYVRVRHFLRTRKYEAAAKIQRAWRCYKARQELQKLQEEKLRLWAEKEEAVRVIQRRWIERIRMQKERRKFLLMKESIVRIQRWYRIKKATAPYVENLRRKRRAVVTIQQRWRSLILARRQRKHYLKLRNVTEKCQKLWRAKQVGRKVYQTFRATKKATMLVQSKWRALREMRKDREAFQNKRNAASIIQLWWRSILQLKRDRNSYLLKKHAVYTIEKWWTDRKIVEIEKRKFEIMRRSVITIQRTWRRYSQTKSSTTWFKQKTNACRIIQQWWRNLKVARKQHYEYLLYRETVIFVQNRWRSNNLAKRMRIDYLAKKEAAINIQANWRMIKERRNYNQFLKRHKAVTLLQMRWRETLNARKVRGRFLALKNAAVNLQRRFRANKACKSAREDYIYVREKIIWIQSTWRKKMENRMRDEAAIGIQTWWMSILAMRKCRQQYECQKAAVLVLQRRYRAYKIGKDTRREYVRVLRSIVTIQRRWRIYIEQKRYEEWLRDRKTAALLIENWWFKILEIRRIRAEELAVLERRTAAAVKIQRIWRGYKVREKMCSILRQLKERSERAAKAAVPTATVAYQIKESMDMLMHCDMLGQLLMCFTKIDTLTRILPSCSVAFCERNLVDKIYTTLNKSNRSLPWMDVIVKCTSILITLSKLPETKKYIYKVEYIETLARFMTITVERHPDLFLHLATLLWLLAENAEYREAITSCPRSTWLLTSLHNKIIKKKSKVAVGNLNKSRLGGPVTALLPNSKPDWGLGRQKRPRLFTTVHHAIMSLIERLNIDTSE